MATGILHLRGCLNTQQAPLRPLTDRMAGPADISRRPVVSDGFIGAVG